MAKQKEPCISVIIPMYKVEIYLKRCLDSVLNQNYQNLEIIAVDDGSPDRCGAIAEEYAARDERIKVIHQKNQGLSCTRNTGIEAATGEWIFFVDSDDELPENAIRLLWETAEKEQVLMSMGGYYVCIHKNGKVEKKQVHVIPQVLRTVEGLHTHFLSDGKNFNYVWMKLYHRSVFEKVRFSEGKYYEDIYIFPAIIEAAGSVAIVDVPVYYYHLRDNSITFGSKIPTHMDGMYARLEWKKLVEQKYPKLLCYSADTILEFCCYLMGKISLHGRRKHMDYWNQVTDCFQRNISLAAKKSIYLKAVVILFYVSPVLLGKMCCLYSRIKNSL